MFGDLREQRGTIRAAKTSFNFINRGLTKRRTLAAAVAIAVGSAAGVRAQAGLIITPDLSDPSLTAPAKTSINAAITLFQTQFATIRDNNVSIYFKLGDLGEGGLGESNSTPYAFTYPQYTGALNTAATNLKDPITVSAVKNLGSGNGAGGTGKVQTTSADARMLSADGANLNALPICGGTCKGLLDKNGMLGGTFDGVITLNNHAGVLDYSRSDNFATGDFDAMRTIEHEIDEVLGIGGPASQLPQNTNANGTIGDEDLFRYSAKGIPSLTTDPNAMAFFSYDGGATDIANFNQGFTGCLPEDCGNFADWANTAANTGPEGCGSGLVQDAFACPKQNADMNFNSPEGQALQAIGYDPVLEPGTLSLVGSGLVAIFLVRCRRPKRQLVLPLPRCAKLTD